MFFCFSAYIAFPYLCVCMECDLFILFLPAYYVLPGLPFGSGVFFRSFGVCLAPLVRFPWQWYVRCFALCSFVFEEFMAFVDRTYVLYIGRLCLDLAYRWSFLVLVSAFVRVIVFFAAFALYFRLVNKHVLLWGRVGYFSIIRVISSRVSVSSSVSAGAAGCFPRSDINCSMLRCVLLCPSGYSLNIVFIICAFFALVHVCEICYCICASLFFGPPTHCSIV